MGPQSAIEHVATATVHADSLHALMKDGSADLAIAVIVTRRLMAVGRWYLDFTQTSEATVLALLREAASGT